MRPVRSGRTGLPVSRLCLGTMTFGLQDLLPAASADLPADVKAQLDGLTADYRMGDDPR